MPKAKSKKPVDLDRNAASRYLQLSSLFRRRIEYGDWPVGRQIPTIDDLAAECGVAPATIRKALGGLVEEGLLARYRAKGTYVLRSPIESFWREIETDGQGFLRARINPSITVISDRIVPRPAVTPQPEGALAPAYRMVRRVYSRDGRPFVFTDLYVDADAAKAIPRRALKTLTIRHLIGMIPDLKVRSIRQTMTIAGADIEASHLLNIPLNTPVARIDRTRLDSAGRLIAISIGIYRGDVVRLDFLETLDDED